VVELRRVHVRAAAACRVVDPERATSVEAGALVRMCEAAQAAICQRVADTDLAALLEGRDSRVQIPPRHHINCHAEHWGVQVT
jgi:hypothetical protein